MADIKTINDRHQIKPKNGGGQLRREVWQDKKTGKVTRYNLAYINHEIHAGDNGRVIGYDNAHDYHHRHHFGVVSSVEFISLEDIENKFESDWRELLKK